MKGLSVKAGLTANVLVFGIASLLTDLSSEMIFPLLPFYMVSILGIPYLLVGLIEGAAEGSSHLVMIASGWFSDRSGKRKLTTLLGYTLSTISKPLFAFATSAHQVLMIRISDRMGKGIRTPSRDALLAESVDEADRGKAFGFHRSMDTLGAVLGPLAALFLFPFLWYTGIFLISFIPGLSSIIILWAFAKERVRLKTTVSRLSFLPSIRAFGNGFKRFIFVQAVFSLGNFSYAFFLLRAADLGMPQSLAPVAYLIYNISYVLFAWPVGIAMDKIGRLRALVFGYFVLALSSLGFSLAYSMAQAFALFIVYGLFRATYETSYRALVPQLVQEDLKATAYGILNTVMGSMAILSGLIAGALWQSYGGSVPFIFSFSICFLSVILSFLFLRPKN